MTQREYDKWRKMAKYVIVNSKYYSNNIDEDADELIHNLYLRFRKYKVVKEEINDSYVYMSLRNLHNDVIRVKINEQNIFTQLDDNIDDEETHYDVMDDLCTQEQLYAINRALMTMEDEYKQIYYLYFIKQMSQQKIADNIGMSKTFIQNRISKIKKIIRKSKK